MTCRPLALVFCLSAACSGVISGGGDSPPPSGTPGTPGTPGASPPGVSTPGNQTPPPPATCEETPLAPAPLRRLTRFEYNNTVADLLADRTAPGDALPAEQLGNGFGNDASGQAVSSLLAEQYVKVAEGIAARATETPAALARLAPCAASATGAAEAACARTFITGFVPRAFRRPVSAAESDELFKLYEATRAPAGASFASALAVVIEAVLQAPEFLYRIETGEPAVAGRVRPTGDEMATRLAYFLWGTMPDDDLRAAARAGQLSSPAGVLTQAKRLLADARAQRMVRFFFDNLLPITGLSDLERDKTQYPSFTPALGALMQEETQRLLRHEIFEGSGSFTAALTAPHTFVNASLARFYGLPAVTGTELQKVPLDTTRRLGFLTHGSVMAGTTHSNHTNPVVRGAFVAHKLLCLDIPLPDASIADKVKPPDPYSGKTARDRYTQHRADPVCSSCHAIMDPIGFALENYDAVGLYRTQENGVTIDASGGVPGVPGAVDGPVGLVRKLASAEPVASCFTAHWLELAFGKTLGPDDACLKSRLTGAFVKSGHDVRELLLALTQSDAFLYHAGREARP